MKCFASLILVVVVGVLFPGAVAHASAILPDDLFGYWELDGNLADSAPAIQGLPGPGLDGTYAGGTPVFVTVGGRQALDLASVGSNYVQTPAYLGDGPKTMVLWVNSTYSAGHALWAGNEGPTGNRFYGGHNRDSGTGNLRPWLGAGNNNQAGGSFAGTAPNDGQWHMYAVTDTGNGGTVSMYQDGGATPIHTLNYGGSTASSSGIPFAIGRAGGGGGTYYARAVIDDVALFNRMLLPTEMAAIHSFGSVSAYMAATPPMPKFSWLFDGNAKTQLGGIDGTLHGYGSPEVLPTFNSTSPVPPLSYAGNEYIKFDSGNQYVDFGNNPGLQITDAITVSFWFNSATLSGDKFMLGKYGGNGERSWAVITSGNKLRLLLSKDGNHGSSSTKDYYSTGALSPNQWRHAAFTFADNDARLYLDGVELTVAAGTLDKVYNPDIETLFDSPLNLNAGRRSSDASYYHGLLDEVAIWNSVLSGDQIKWLYYSSIHAIPEPSTSLLLLLGGASLAWPRRRRRRAYRVTSVGVLAVTAWALLLGPEVEPASASLLGYWRLDGDVTDASGQNPGAAFDTEGGSPASFVTGVYGDALDLSGGKGHIDTTISLSGGPKSVVFFAKVNNYTTQQVWVGNEAPTDNRFYLGSQDGKPFLGAGGTTDNNGTWATTDTTGFHHYALVQAPLGERKLTAYQNGQVVGTVTYPSGQSTATSPGKDFEIGRAGGAGNVAARAIFDDLAVFGNALTANAIGYIAQNGVDAYLESTGGRALYREVFPHRNPGDDYVNRILPAEGWQAHYDNGLLSGTTELAREEGAPPLEPVNSFPTKSELLPGYIYRNAVGAGRDYLYWTQEHAIPNVDDIHLVSWYQRNELDTDRFRVALRLDVGGTPGNTGDDVWFASMDEFTNQTALEIYTNGQPQAWYLNRLLRDEATWQVIDFVPGSSLELVSGQVPLPAGVAVTGFGLYTPEAVGAQRVDLFSIYEVPEPSSAVLIALGALGMLLLAGRKRR
ncbi:MAG: LamG-like jellyroll fold domain-containing protein [Thermoguttaceae bacterium]|jgi:hypothetical protein|nr:LamG-like jellyroll fold domain-containing protein [Thermoguttaceae bacterium]